MNAWEAYLDELKIKPIYFVESEDVQVMTLKDNVIYVPKQRVYIYSELYFWASMLVYYKYFKNHKRKIKKICGYDFVFPVRITNKRSGTCAYQNAQ
jgi:hypothetical protein